MDLVHPEWNRGAADRRAVRHSTSLGMSGIVKATKVEFQDGNTRGRFANPISLRLTISYQIGNSSPMLTSPMTRATEAMKTGAVITELVLSNGYTPIMDDWRTR